MLVGNFGDGTINAYDTQGHFIGQATDTAGHVISNPGLWDMVFGTGGTGDPNTLYFTAGGSNQTSGLFATLVPATAAPGADFSLNLSAHSVTVTAGGTRMLTIGSAAVGGFNGQITRSCAPAAGLTCAFSPSTISPGSTVASSTLTVAAAATTPGGGYGHPGVLLISGLGLCGAFFASSSKKVAINRGKSLLLIAVLALLVAGMSFTVACGSSNGQKATNNPTRSTATLTVTGTSSGVSTPFQ